MTDTGLERPPGDAVARAARLATSTLANALDDAGLHHNVMAPIKAVAPGMRFAGPAVPVRAVTGGYRRLCPGRFPPPPLAARAGVPLCRVPSGTPARPSPVRVVQPGEHHRR